MAALITAFALICSGLTFAASAAIADTFPPSGVEETVTADPLPTAQIDGVVWTQAIANNTVWVGGEFTTARPAGAAAGVDTQPRANLMSYNLTTGEMTSWNPGANAVIKSIVASPDGSRIYVGGSFTTIAGQTRYRIAAFDTATGALLPWAPFSNAQVSAITTSGDTVYLVGNFTSLAGSARTRLGAVSATTATLLPLTATISGGYGVAGIVMNPDLNKLVIAGSFTSVNGSTNPGRGMAALDASSGASLPWAVNSLIRNAGTNAAMTALTADGDSVYGTGYSYSGATAEDGFEGTFRANWTDGSMVWMDDCHGDNYSVAVSSGVVYTSGHDHYCGNIGGFPQTSPTWTFHHSLAYAKEYHGNVLTADIYGYKSYTGKPASTLLHWFPDWQVGTYTGKSQATWDVEANSDYVLYGGEFLKVNNKPQQGLVRFAKKALATNKSGPQQSGDTFPISATSLRAGEVRLAWTANTDRDNATLTYQVFRQDKGSTPIYTTTADSNFWTTPRMTFVDTTVTAGQTYQYRVRAIDPTGNVATGSWSQVTVSTANQASDYSLRVVDDGAVHYWPLSETSGTAGLDWTGASNLTVTGATRGVAGPNTASPTTATQFAGASSSLASTAADESGMNVLTVEAWFQTSSTKGGKIVSFGNKSTGSSTSYDRQLYIDGSGRVTFGVNNGTAKTLSTGTGYNNGQWHYAVGTMNSAGMTLYIDGVRAGTRVDTTSAQTYSGYWRVGGDTVGSWPNAPTSAYLNGSIADVAIYNVALSRGQVDAHWTASGRSSVLPAPPTDAYGKAIYDLAPTLYWRLGESAGATAADSGLDGQTGTYFGNVTKGVAGVVSSVANSAVTLAPTKVGSSWTQTGVSSDKSYTNPTTFAEEAWFKTTTTTGGKIVGFGSSRTGTSSSYDRHLFMTADGKVNFGVYNGVQNTISSATGLNNGQWHHAVGQMSSAGMQLYIDGALVASNANTTVNSYTGYWRVGGDSSWSGDPYFKGSVDEVAIYAAPLSAAQVLAHYQQATLGFVNHPPAASFTSIVSDQTVAFDAGGSSDPDGPITSYAWNFGDGTTGTGVTASHSYATAGTYQVSLTVKDQYGASGTIVQEVVALAPNQLPAAAFTTSANRLTVTADGSTSSDPDGSIATYSWSWGDGSTAAGAQASHTFGASGTYTIALTVTDDRGGSATTTHDVTVELPANQLPAAAFTAQPTNMSVAFDASTSTDPDGTIVGYAWAYGDGTSGSGATASHAYLTPGSFDVTLTVTDDRGGSATVTHTVTASLAPNQSPLASFAKVVSNLAVSVDATASVDPDGSIASYAWAFGDGATATGVSASHDYATPGVYTITLTVTDDRGGTASTTASVDVSVSNVLAQDQFERTVSNGWGTSDQGGAWTTVGTSSRFAVTGGIGRISVSTGQAQEADLKTVSSKNTRVTADFSVDKVADGQYISVVGRQVGASQYILRLRPESGGVVRIYVLRDATAIGASVLTGVTLVPGEKYSVSFEVTGSSPTTLSAKVWKSSDTEPASWQAVRTDGTAALQAAGSVGVFTWLPSSAAASAPVAVSFDNVSAIDPTVTPTPANQLPTAAFTAAAADLTASVDATASTDPDGTIASYAWSFGDGATATGVTASHPYTTAGTYTVSLTVTDNRGGQATVTHDIAVVAPNQAPVAAFVSSTSGLTASVDASTSSDPDGSIASYAWDFGDGASATGVTASHPYATGGTYPVSLTVTDNRGGTNTTTAQVSVNAPPPPADPVLASDLFERTGAGGWGTADKGGAWSIASGAAAAFSVTGGAGVMTVSNSTTLQASLSAVSSKNTKVVATFTVDKIANAQYITLIGRQVGSDMYSLRARVAADGTIQLYTLRNATAIGAAYTVPGLVVAPGTPYTLAFQVQGTGTTNLSAKMWKTADAEPAWQATRTDTTAALQAAGSVGVSTYVATSANAYPVKLAFTDIAVTDPTIQ